MSINPHELDDYIEQRRYLQAQKKEKKKSHKSVTIELNRSEIQTKTKKKSLFSRLFKNSDDYIDEEVTSLEENIKKDDESSENTLENSENIEQKFDDDGNIVDKDDLDSEEKSEKKGFFSWIFKIFSKNDSSEDFDEDKDETKFSENMTNSEDMIKTLGAISRILGRISQSGIELIRKSDEYKILTSMRDKYVIQKTTEKKE